MEKRGKTLEQTRNKERYDQNKCVKQRELERGQWVRVRLPKTNVKKGELRYSYPQQIEEVSENSSAVKLRNGQWWNASKVVKVGQPNPQRGPLIRCGEKGEGECESDNRVQVPSYDEERREKVRILPGRIRRIPRRYMD